VAVTGDLLAATALFHAPCLCTAHDRTHL